MLKLEARHAEAIKQHAMQEYPHECCGVLVGLRVAGKRQVCAVVPLPNLRHDPQRSGELLPLKNLGHETARNRYLIDPFDLLRVIKDARARGFVVLGYYHSHPDQPATPSVHDRELAWPGYAYLIVAVKDGEPGVITGWRVAGDALPFEAESLEWVNPKRTGRISKR